MEFTADNIAVAINGSSNKSGSTAANHRSDNSKVPGRLSSIEQALQITSGDSIVQSQSVAVQMSPSTEEKSAAALQATEKNHSKDEEKSKILHKPKRHEKPKEEVTFRTHLTSLAHISVLVFVYLVLKLAFRGDFVFFTWHPILMSTGWMLLMTEGFYSINKYNTYWRFKTKGDFRVKVHVTILAIGYILSLTGFVIVYLNKERDGKHHIATWHALFGLLGIIFTFPPVINGFLLWYKKELANYISKPRLVKFVHVSSGVLAFTFGALALVLSVYSRWYGKKSDHSNYIFYFGLVTVTYPLVWAIYGPSVKLARVIKEYFSEDKDD